MLVGKVSIESPLLINISSLTVSKDLINVMFVDLSTVTIVESFKRKDQLKDYLLTHNHNH
uniref:Uncharacterized protein n=1 Tax=Timema poppense TaxID=170557 RepID=A0A7R9DNC5_TIMPO|nr:unnamed protein product [Timema poppensis]